MVLVVEDEDGLRLAVCKMLRKRGFSVIEASDGRAGVDLFRANERKINVVLLDLTLPEMTGGGVFREVRRIEPGRRAVNNPTYQHDCMRKKIWSLRRMQ